MKNNGAGKGDKPREFTDKETYRKNYRDNYTRIFGEYVPPRQKRIKELKKDLRQCRKYLKDIDESNEDYPGVLKIIDAVQEELKELT